MRRLVLTVVLSFVSLHHSALIGDSLNSKAIILSELLANECPGVIPLKSSGEDKVSYVHLLERELLKCRQDKLVFTNSKTTAAVTSSTPPVCPSYKGDSVFNIQFISYNNPNRRKATGVLCGTDGSPCRFYIEICISSIKSTYRNCNFHHIVSVLVGKNSKTGVSENFGNLTNPMKINLGKRKWKGAFVRIKIMKKNQAISPRVYREVEEFSYGLTDVQGSLPRLLTLHGALVTNKTELVVMFTVPCPSSSTTTSPVPAECRTATNLTESWRLDHSGREIRPGGAYSLNGRACDLYDMGWFRFTGAAGTRMLDKCPKRLSCGTYKPLWTDEAPPQAVGIAANISTYVVRRDVCKNNAQSMQVMRCSLKTDHDLIYRYIGPYVTGTKRCRQAFCGTN